jgi:hypothetical protein
VFSWKLASIKEGPGLRRGEPGPWLSRSLLPLELRCAALAVEQDVEGVAVGDVVVALLAVYVVDVAVLHHDYVAARATIYVVVSGAADQQVLAETAKDGVIAVAAFYPIAAGIAIE